MSGGANAVSCSGALEQVPPELLRAILDAPGDLEVFVKDAQGRYLFINRAGAALLGRTAAEIVGRTDEELFSPETARALRGSDLAVLSSGEARTVEETISPVNDRHYATTRYPLRDGQGAVTGVIGVARDVTERKRAEQELRLSEERFRRMVDSDILGVYSGDGDGQVLVANDGFLRMVGYSREDLGAGRIHLRALNPPERPWPDPAARADAARRGWAAPYEKDFVRKDGTRVPLLLGGTVLRPDYSEWIGFALDLSERKRAEREVQALNRDLRNRVDELETLLAVLPIGIGISRDPQCRHITHNPYFARLLKMPPERNGSLSAPAGERPGNYRLVKDGRELRPDELPMQRAAALARDVVGWEAELHVEGSPPVSLLGHAAPLFDESGRTRGTIGAFLDISARKRAERAQALLARAGQVLASSLDHEATLQAVADLAVPELADICFVELLDEGGELRRVASAHALPHKAELLRDLARFGSGGRAGSSLRRAVAEGQSLLVPEVPESAIDDSAVSPEHAALMKQVGPCSALSTPLRVQGRSLGVITLLMADSQRRYGPEELALAEELSRRAAAAVENARLYRAAEQARAQAEAAAQRSAYLAQAGELLASSLDLEQTLQAVVRLLVPRLADVCSVMLLGDDGVPRRVAEIARDERTTGLLRRLREVPLPPSAHHPLQVALSGQMVHVTDYAAKVASFADETPEYCALIRELEPRESLLVPLVFRGRVLGVLSMAKVAVSGRYPPEDVTLVVDLARQVAQAVENNRLYREAQEAIRLRDDFLSIASHELRTPLAALQLQVLSVLRASNKGPATLSSEWVSSRAAKAASNVERLSSLVDKLLDVTRLTSGHLELHLEEVDLAAITRDVAERFLDQLHASRLTVHAEHPVVGRWDRFRLEQVVTNLVANAIKYGRGQPVELEVTATFGEARLRVTDQGIGISPELQARIFDRFERAVSSRQYGGFGLGLWISRQIVEAMGGRITVESQPDVGSTFAVLLPRDGDGAEK
jgi:PAS domain S-box-containing protein